jgi:hypothetical protein
MRVYTHARSLHARRRWCRATPMTSAQLKPMILRAVEQVQDRVTRELPLHPVYVTCPQIRESRQLRGVPDRLITSTPIWSSRPRCTEQAPTARATPAAAAAHRRSPRHRPRRVVPRSAASCREWGGNQPIRPNRRSQNLRLVLKRYVLRHDSADLP